ncbi:MAG: hypothetical protein JNL32_06300 [Candidatus Kapabacteria bacterium]|nr:hypothetical protein [Candidatus Kapabacteria bacterium]
MTTTHINRTLLLSSILILSALIFSACPDGGRFPTTMPPQYSSYRPIIADRSYLDSIAYRGPKKITNAGKIYKYGSMLLINEPGKGYHVIDNSVLEQPKNIGYLAVYGTNDCVIRDNILYCDNSRDLLMINIEDLAAPKISGRLRDVFPKLVAPDNLPIAPENEPKNAPANTVIVGWTR